MFDGPLERVLTHLKALRQEVAAIQEVAAQVPEAQAPAALDLLLQEMERLGALLDFCHPSLRAAADRERGGEIEDRLWQLIQLARLGASSANEAWELELFTDPDIQQRLGFSPALVQVLQDPEMLTWTRNRISLPDPE